MARRAASIWRAVIRPRATAFRPNSPNDTAVPRVCEMPVLRPFCSLRYFLRDGCSMLILLLSQQQPAWQDGEQLERFLVWRLDADERPACRHDADRVASSRQPGSRSPE